MVTIYVCLSCDKYNIENYLECPHCGSDELEVSTIGEMMFDANQMVEIYQRDADRG